MDTTPPHETSIASGSASPPPQQQQVQGGLGGGSPTDFLKGVVGKKVVVRLTSGVDYRGELDCNLLLL